MNAIRFFCNLTGVKVGVFFGFTEFAHQIPGGGCPRFAPQLSQALFYRTGIVNADHAVKYKVANDGKTDRDKQPDIKPKHAAVLDLFCRYRISKKGAGKDDANKGIPEILNLMTIDIIVFLFVILNHQDPKLMIKQYDGGQDDQAYSTKNHIRIPGFEKISGVFHTLLCV